MSKYSRQDSPCLRSPSVPQKDLGNGLGPHAQSRYHPAILHIHKWRFLLYLQALTLHNGGNLFLHLAEGVGKFPLKG